MRRVRRTITKGQRRAATALQATLPLDDGTVRTPTSLTMIQALIPLGLKAVEEALLADVIVLAGPRYERDDAHPGVVRWGKQGGSIYLADQTLAITVPRVRDRCRRTRSSRRPGPTISGCSAACWAACRVGSMSLNTQIPAVVNTQIPALA